MRKIALAALALSAAITTQAKADYVWQFVPTRVTAMNMGGLSGSDYTPTPGVSHAEAKSWLPEFAIRVTNPAFDSRSLSLNWSGCYEQGSCQVGPSGDFSKLAGFDRLYAITPDSLYGSGIIDLAWTKRGKMTGDIEFYGMVRDLTLTSLPGRNSWSGWFQADDSMCGVGGVTRCDIEGHWAFLGDPPAGGTSVPEPASIAMLAFGLLGAGAARKFG